MIRSAEVSMKIQTRLCLVLLAILLSVQPLGVAQAQDSGISVHISWVNTTDFPNVTVHFSAWDAAGLPLADLQVDYFTLQEDGGPQLTPVVVQKSTEAPLTVALVLDVSQSMSNKPLVDAKSAAARFLDHLEPGDQAAVIAFGSDLDKDPANLRLGRELAFSGDLDPVYDLIEGLDNTTEKTHLYNAATKAALMTADQPAGHRAVLLLTDGRNDPPDLGFPNEAINIAKDENIPFFVIGMGQEIDEAYLRNLANETGGLFRSVPSSAELGDLFNSMANLLKTQYELTYESQLPADSAFHQLELTLNIAGMSAAHSIEFGPLQPETAPATPTAVPPTKTPTEAQPTDLPEPTSVPPTAIPPTDAPVETEPDLPAEQTKLGWLWWLGGGVVGLIVLWLVLRGRGEKPVEEVCAKCGFDLTGKTGACPQCEHNQRLPKFRQ
jgi:VWFA-related protein